MFSGYVIFSFHSAIKIRSTSRPRFLLTQLHNAHLFRLLDEFLVRKSSSLVERRSSFQCEVQVSKIVDK